MNIEEFYGVYCTPNIVTVFQLTHITLRFYAPRIGELIYTRNFSVKTRKKYTNDMEEIHVEGRMLLK